MKEVDSSLKKQQQFAAEYMKDQDATRAAVRAGYARKGAAASGRRLLQNIRVQAELHRLEEAEQEKENAVQAIEKQEVLDFLTVVLRGGAGKKRFSPAEEENLGENPEFFRARMRAAELLGRHLNLFGDTASAKKEFYIPGPEVIRLQDLTDMN